MFNTIYMRKESVNYINTNTTPLILELFLMGRMDLIDTWIMNIRLQVSEFELQITTFLSLLSKKYE